MTRAAVYQLRLPKSVKAAVERYARADGVSMNMFMSSAVAEKLSAMESARFFQDRYERMNLEKFDEILSRTGGEPPRGGDELPDGYVSSIKRKG